MTITWVNTVNVENRLSARQTSYEKSVSDFVISRDTTFRKSVEKVLVDAFSKNQNNPSNNSNIITPTPNN